MISQTGNKTIFVTGAAGFIGFHAVQRLHQLGYQIIALDNFNDYYDPSLKQARAYQLKILGISVIKGDITDFALLEKITSENRIDTILHLAAQAGVRYSLKNPHTYISTNIQGFLNILEICRLNPKVPLIYASSSSVYGRNETIPFHEHHQTDHQASLYGVTKKSNELMATTYHHLFGIPVTGLRFFTVYGPWGRPDMAYYSFAKAITENQTIDIYNYGKMSRDFTYIDDIIDGIIAAIQLKSTHEIFNLGNNQPEELGTLIQYLEESLSKKAQLQYVSMQPGDVESTYADISLSQQKLGFQPKVSLREGIQKFVSWYTDFQAKQIR